MRLAMVRLTLPGGLARQFVRRCESRIGATTLKRSRASRTSGSIPSRRVDSPRAGLPPLARQIWGSYELCVPLNTLPRNPRAGGS